VQAVIWGVQELKKSDWAMKRERHAGPWEKEPNRSGSSEPDRFKISYLKAISGFFFIFSFSFSFFSLSRQRGSALSLEFRPSSPAGRPVPARWPASHHGCASAPDAKQSPCFYFFHPFSSIPSPLSDSWLKNFNRPTQISRSRI